MKEVIKDHLGNIYKTKKERAEAYGISNKRVDARLRAGYTLEEALTTPLFNNAGVVSIDHLGNKFPTITAMCKHWNVTVREYNNRKSKGYTLEECLTGASSERLAHLYDKEYIDCFGRKWVNKQDMYPFYGIKEVTYLYRLRAGMSEREALTKPTITIVTDFKGNEFDSLQAMCDYYNIDYSVVRTRLKAGWELELALTVSTTDSLSSYAFLVKEQLDIKSISYETEYTNHNCYSSKNGKSRFDFSIVNTGLIEVDGEQHFFPVSDWDFEKCQKDDSIKTKYCENNNIPLLRIKYTQVQSGEYKSMIDDFIANPKKYIYNHNTYLSTKEYYME